jgi:putative oxidoreductase
MTDDIGKLVLRLTLGILILLHGIAKLVGGVAGVEKMLQSIGLPSYFAFGVYVGEVLAPILVIIGLYARVGAGIIVVNMLFAVALAHRQEVLTLGKTGGWALELQGMFLLTALAIALMGPGRISINQR